MVAEMTDIEQQTPERKPRSQHAKIFTGLAAGIVLGLICNALFAGSPTLDWLLNNLIAPFGQVFMRLIFMAVIPLIFSALALGVAELGDVRQLGRIGIKTLLFTLVLTTLSVVIGITLVNLVHPGAGLEGPQRDALMATISGSDAKAAVENASKAKTIIQMLLDVIPKNPIADMALAFDPKYQGGGILAIMFFSLFVGIALALVRSERTEVFEKWLQGLYDIVMKIIGIAMKLAPYGVAALVFTVTAKLGLNIVMMLGKFVLVVLVGLLIQMIIVYSTVLKYAVGVSPWKFFKNVQEVILTAFSTSSSNVTLPVSLRVTEEKLHVPRNITNFVLTLGSTANQNGTALYEGVVVLFLAQFFGVHLTVIQQVSVVLAAVLAGIGTAGVPGGSLPVIVLVLQSVGVPGEAIGVIFGVNRILDMSRTVLNVVGDITVAMYIAKSEGVEMRL
jgi:dicarboxylate/amino acid:cation (Na+ or H+) symporter, DAACS family